MAAPDAEVIVDWIAPFSFTAGAPPAEAPPSPRSIAVPLKTTARVYLDPDAHGFRTWGVMLRMLSEVDVPAYIECAPGTRLVQKVLVPKETKVRELTPLGNGYFHVRLSGSATRQLVDSRDVHALNLLREAWQSGQTVIITDDPETHVIFDVRPGAARADASTEGAADMVTKDELLRTLTPISMDNARDLIASLRGEHCYSLDPLQPEGCFPLYPDRFCWATAHRICQLLQARNYIAGKIWVFDRDVLNPALSLRTRYHPDCRCFWDWHVAPCLRLDASADLLVFDLAGCFDSGPLVEREWLATVNGVDADIDYTFSNVYKQEVARDRGRIGPMPRHPESHLVAARAELLGRILRRGEPPYSYCRH